jgi:ubiquitin
MKKSTFLFVILMPLCTLGSDGLKKYAKFASFAPDTNAFQISVKASTGKSITLSVKSNNTISEVKKKILAEAGVPKNQQTLLFMGKQLKDERMLSDYNIQKGATLDIIISFKTE